MNVTPTTTRFSGLSCSKFDLLGRTFCQFTSFNLCSLQLESVKFNSECKIGQTLFELEIACFVIIIKKMSRVLSYKIFIHLLKFISFVFLAGLRILSSTV